jgi:hypothetical protein
MPFLKRYSWLRLLGGEVAYLICILGGCVRHEERKIYDALFETLSRFTWGNLGV